MEENTSFKEKSTDPPEINFNSSTLTTFSLSNKAMDTKTVTSKDPHQ